ncbi:YihY/virulence factor BrkB family protein [Rubrolithibacter danxiaensis]|uniref:YihY/virulence factor BrkB family protein n=1 Tax=Rubrolithibacter danxiaensis TaxID=3390805 RepID=UPI003BF80EBC
MKKIFTKEFWKEAFAVLKATFAGFSNDRAMKFSASLAYYTIFSLAPLLILIISLAGIFLKQDAFENRVFTEMKDLIGSNAALQLQEIIKNLALSGKSNIALIIGIVTLVIGATGVFIEIQDSLNIIWRVKPKPKKGWLQFLKNRLLSSSLIIAVGFLLIVSLVINGAILALFDILTRYLPDVTVILINIANLVISFIVITTLFAIIFKFLPDVKIGWKDVRGGAIFTAILFMIGRLLIGLYIQKSGTESTYGAAGSLIVILLWVYYTAAILYFGAEFTQVYSERYGKEIQPADYAVHLEQKEIEKDVDVLPPQKN